MEKGVSTRKSASSAKDKIKVGDKVIHDIYGEGMVVSLENKILSIAFSYPHGIKKILSGHQSIKKLIS